MAPLRYAAQFDPFLSLDCTRVEGVGAQSKERKGSNFAAQRSRAIVVQAQRAKHIRSKNLAIAIWQPWKSLLHLGSSVASVGEIPFPHSGAFFPFLGSYQVL